MGRIPILYYRLGSSEPAEGVIYFKPLRSDGTSGYSVFSSDNSDLTVSVITDYTEQTLHKVVYNPVNTVNLSAGALNLSLQVAPTVHTFLTWDVSIKVEILCDFTTESSSICSPKLLQTQNHEDSLIQICSTDSSTPTYPLDIMTFAQDLTQQNSDDEYLRFSLFTRDSTNDFS